MSLNTLNNTVKLSAAGSGKTWDICHAALEAVKDNNKRALIITYTNRSAESARNEIRKQNDGVLHSRVIIRTWFRFLLSDMIKPYQTGITQGRINHIKSIDFSELFGQINRNKKGFYGRYINSRKDVRANQASELALLLNERNNGRTIKRLEEIYSNIYFDEIQDLAGYDINILNLLMVSAITITCCGDNKQATFKTHVARKNNGQTGKKIWEYFKKLEKDGIIHVEKNLSSRRFNRNICCFANTIYPGEDPINTIMQEETGHDGVFLISTFDVDLYYNCFLPQVLRFDSKTIVHRPCLNFGACKGETFDRVMIYPNSPLKDFILNGTALNAPEKYYVGVTRSRYSIAIVMERLPVQLNGYEESKINICSHIIRALKFNPDCSLPRYTQQVLFTPNLF